MISQKVKIKTAEDMRISFKENFELETQNGENASGYSGLSHFATLWQSLRSALLLRCASYGRQRWVQPVGNMGFKLWFHRDKHFTIPGRQ